MESTLIRADLEKLSVKQLEKFAEGVDGVDLELVNEVIAEKRSKLEQMKDDPAVKKELEESAEKKAAAEKIKEAKEAERKAREEAKEAAKKAREEKLAEAKKLKDEVLEQKAKAIEERKALKEAKEKEKASSVAAREEKRVARKEAREAAEKELEERRKDRMVKQSERAEQAASKLAEMKFETKPNKTQQVRDCLMKGMSNSQIATETGFSTKFVCDTVWRIERQIEANEYIESRRAQLAVEKLIKETGATDNAQQTAE